MKSKKKRILFVTVLPLWSLGNKSGGRALYSTINHYIDNGYDVLFITDKKVDYNLTNLDAKNVFYIDTSYFTSKFGIKKIGYIFKVLYVRYFKHQVDMIFKSLDKNNLLIYAYEVHAVMACKNLAKKYNLPLVTRFQGTIMANKKYNLINKIRFYPHFQALATPSNLIIMTNDGTQGNAVLKACNNISPVLFIRNGVNILDNNVNMKRDNELIKKLNIQNKTVLLTVSRLETWKKVERAIYTLYELKNTNYYLIIVGDGAMMDSLKSLVAELNLTNQVTFTGAIPNSDVYRYMLIADIFLSFYDLSNVGNPLLEALCLGKAIITYNVGDTNQVINGSNGILLDNVKPKHIASVIKGLSDKDIKKYGEKAKEYADANLYSWKKRMMIEEEKVMEVFDEFFGE